MVVKLRNQVQNKVLAAKYHNEENDKDTNLNLIKRWLYHLLKLILVTGLEDADFLS